MSGAVEIPAYMLTAMILPLIGRRNTLGAYMLLGGGALLAIIPLGKKELCFLCFLAK